MKHAHRHVGVDPTGLSTRSTPSASITRQPRSMTPPTRHRGIDMASAPTPTRHHGDGVGVDPEGSSTRSISDRQPGAMPGHRHNLREGGPLRPGDRIIDASRVDRADDPPGSAPTPSFTREASP